MSMYCGNEVNICQGSKYKKEATKYNPNVAAKAIRMIPDVAEEKKDLKNSSNPCLVSISFELPPRALTTK